MKPAEKHTLENRGQIQREEKTQNEDARLPIGLDLRFFAALEESQRELDAIRTGVVARLASSLRTMVKIVPQPF